MSALDFNAMVQSLRAQGVPLALAESTARRECGLPAPDLCTQRDANVLEKAEQAEVTKTFRAFGFDVYSLSQPRATKQSPGLPDLWCVHRERPIAFWWETKRQVGGRLSPAQMLFQESCQRCDVGYGTGDRHAAADHLIALGLAFMTAIATLEPIHNSIGASGG
jgi:hypothetical protein